MKYYQSIVVGGGHAGVEAALALAKQSHKTLLITGNLQQIASLPCNPSIGGPAKGVVVREIDALGGIMGKAADICQIQMKMLNTSKGPAVRSLRAQIDKIKYPQFILQTLKKTSNLTLIEDLVENLIIQENDSCVKGVKLISGKIIYSDIVILTTGTYLTSKVLIGSKIINSGPNKSPTTYGISEQLKKFGMEVIRLKTGTPPRVHKDTIDYSKTIEQAGDKVFQTFSSPSVINDLGVQKLCFLTHTNDDTHQLIRKHLHKSAMYSGYIYSSGPRYCPSIEDKIVRFCDKNRHQLFIEPESLLSDEMYLQGLSMSMPCEVQEEILKTIPAFAKAKILKYAYAIEYDAFNPNQLFHTLESKKIKNLFLAGQINGTSGYEEAACQGLIAGINSALKIQNKPPFILKRNEAYIGVLIDDLINKGTYEPYRLLTSRAEFRLLLRHDNADLRLMPYGFKFGLVDEKTFDWLKKKQIQIDSLKERLSNFYLDIDDFRKLNINFGSRRMSLYQLLKRSDLNEDVLYKLFSHQYSVDILEQVGIQIKYEDYILKSEKEVKKNSYLEEKIIPSNIDYRIINNLSQEAKEKLTKIKPFNIAQASRISGVNPVDINILLIYLQKYSNSHV
ncbi:tRNA uridine-5-carboxymethylaminomethyl(34) synthesis enzyme MnmG [Candidatus Phytoplasma bonamiae]|uniref:tRNA uridine 5-carboxymethylaminomethyl modification enzyme MnmG n=1 Tax=Candidatus Phytoplasma bonamiae TaxID=2982626 RepID=A0ABT9D3J6_9MOLU|nr:tRNA uridine-5-carboxymethylaminomethyl(34) synthesis enzyme MnmG ['Bonamia sp.' little leaf phytoplasma]MDO8063979.1 tRNA uridine-5-carboxymethylaminomethyl(34) synthesis enzyme MnmG ['Bonamia sp.' little leaf phytoplasma]MDV3174692.1 tRNA uridine-5-carboxymethylaminomethyl(34) synthesis enzyme MnmG ['Bonamia sp.' little leaf phytoplasma]